MNDDNDTEPHNTVTGEIVRREAIDPLAIIEKRNKLMDRLLDAAIRATHSGQWVDQQGKPFPTAAAAEVMARRCGVRIYDVKSQREERDDEDGPSYIYFTTGKAQLGNSEYDIIEAIGTCSSRDQFIGTNPKDGEDSKPLTQVDEGNIMKASYSNFLVNAITRLLGVRNMTWEQLGKFGVDASGAARVDYAEGSKGGGKGKSATFPYGDNKGKTPADAADKDLEWWAKRLTDDLANTDPAKAKFKPSNEKLLAAVKEEMAKRANAKAGVGGKPKDTAPSLWDRLKLLSTQLGVTEEKLKAVTKAALKKETVNPADLTEPDFKTIADALEVAAQETASETSKKAGF